MNIFEDILNEEVYRCYELDGNYLGNCDNLDDALNIVECAIITCKFKGCGWVRVIHNPPNKYVETVVEALEHVNFDARFVLCTITQAREVLKILIENQRGDINGIF